MNGRFQSVLPTVATVLLALLAQTGTAKAEMPGYQPPNFQQLAFQSAVSAQAAPMPASPLAGGFSAAQGGAYMDAQGNSIVMPAGYCQGGQPGYSGGGYCPGGGYDQGMAVDFGGYGTDQCGPHYFDVSADVVYLRSENLFPNVDPFTTAGVGITSPQHLDIQSGNTEYKPGWRIAARLDLGPLSVFEATYMGLYDLGYRESVNSVDVTGPDDLYSIFNEYGAVGAIIVGVDEGRTHSIDYQSDLQSTEFSFRRYWVGNSPRLTGTYLMGARYLRMTENFAFNSVSDAVSAAGTAARLWDSENDLVGFQIGMDGALCLRQGLRIEAVGKSGIYNNRFKFHHSGTFTGTGSLPNFSSDTEGNQVAFAAEGGVTVVADILPSWSIRGGYQVLYLNSLATVGDNIDQSNISATAVTVQSDALFHGFHGGFEYVW